MRYENRTLTNRGASAPAGAAEPEALGRSHAQEKLNVGGREIELRDFRGQQRGRLGTIRIREDGRRHTKFHHDAIGVVGVDRSAPTVIDFGNIVSVRDPTIAAHPKVVEITGCECDVVDPFRQSEAS